MNWLEQIQKYLIAEWGLDATFAVNVSYLLYYLSYYGISWRITSGWRDPKKQSAMRDRWDRGDRAGLVVRPAVKSKHTNTKRNLIGISKPASLAIDIVTGSPRVAADIARHVNIRPGYDFRNSDPVHFQSY